MADPFGGPCGVDPIGVMGLLTRLGIGLVSWLVGFAWPVAEDEVGELTMEMTAAPTRQPAHGWMDGWMAGRNRGIGISEQTMIIV